MANDIISIIDEQRGNFCAVIADKGIGFDRERTFAIQALQTNDYLCKVATNNPNSLRAAVVNVAAIGISLNPASKLAYLVPRDGKVCLDISYMGMMHLAQQCGAIQWGQAVLVREGDQFELRGIAQEPVHKYSPFDKDRNLGPVVGVYVVVKTDTGDYLTECMNIEEVYAIRDRSSAWKAWVKDKKKCPWVTDEGEMIKKTVVKRAAKYWPRRDRLDKAIHHLNTDGGEGMAPEKDITPISQDQIVAITDLLNAMEKTWDDLAKVLTSNFHREIGNIEDLSQDEGVKVIAFLNKKKAA